MRWPLDGHHQQSGRMRAQVSATLPRTKQLWSAIVRHKIAMQAAALAAMGKPSAPLSALIPKVKSGDSTNVEAQAARRYWNLLLGKEFRRDQSATGINSLLNYGYMVLRAATARAVVAAGLHPGIGLHHSNASNSMCLIDDLMESFRPIIDLVAVQLVQSRQEEVTLTQKKP
jgi:CRISP-associated protein Cas1